MLTSLLYAAAYCVVGIAMLACGFVVTDLMTPGRLGQRIDTDRSLNAIVCASIA